MTNIFTAFLLTSVIGTALAMILTLLKPITRKVFSASWHYYIWLVVLLVMVLPIRLNLPEKPVTTPPVLETVTITDNQTENTKTPVIIDTQTELITSEQPIQHEKVSTVQAIKDFLSGKVLLFSYIWLIGAILLFLLKITGYIIFNIKIHKNSEIFDCQKVGEYTNRKIKTRISDTICSPLMIGIIKPTLILPKTKMTDEQLHNVLLHEMTHLKRNDILYKWIVSFVKCIHWFNPAIYYIARQVNIDCEISCDMAVVRKMTAIEEKSYIETILSLLTNNNKKAIPLTTGMAGDKNTLKKRFTMIKNKIKISRKAKIISLILAVVLCIGTLLVTGIINGKLNTSNNLLINVTTDERQGNEFNFLMIGVDNTDRIDTIMTFNFDGNTLTCVNIPRNIALAISEDVPVDNSTKTLSNLLAEEDGDQKVVNSIKETLGIPVHYYAKVKMDVIADVVDYVGGIEFDVPYNMTYDDPVQDLHIDLKEGKQVLNGKQVEHLLRFRDHRHPNGEEVRVMTWHSVIKEFLNQVVIGNKISNLSDLYKIATKNIKTNYPLDALTKDFNNFKKINRNNIVIKNIRGRNANLNGYFVFHINYVESEPVLNVFKMTKDGANLVSGITYTNKDMGFTIKLPELWKTKYEIIRFDNQVAFFHKDIFLKYGKGSGNLFRITKVNQPSEKILDETGTPYEYLYSGEEYAYVWSVASDVQYPTWHDRDEEDVELAKDFEDMMMDLNFIKNSFSLIDEESLFTPTNLNENSLSVLHSVIWPCESKTISQSFGKRVHPITGEEKVHNGVDIKVNENSIVVSSISGKVTDAGYDNEFGNFIVIENNMGIKVKYAHLSEVLLKKGNAVSQKDIIGKAGKTGMATGAQLHFEVQMNGEFVDPQRFLNTAKETKSNIETSVPDIDLTTNKDIKLKTDEKASSSDIVLSPVVLNKEMNSDDMEEQLKYLGLSYSNGELTDLKKSFATGECRGGMYSLVDNEIVMCDENGNITLYFDDSDKDYIDITFTDCYTGKAVAEYGVLPDNSKSFSFMGFEKDRIYNVVILPQTKNSEKKIKYIIY